MVSNLGTHTPYRFGEPAGIVHGAVNGAVKSAQKPFKKRLHDLEKGYRKAARKQHEEEGTGAGHTPEQGRSASHIGSYESHVGPGEHSVSQSLQQSVTGSSSSSALTGYSPTFRTAHAVVVWPATRALGSSSLARPYNQNLSRQQLSGAGPVSITSLSRPALPPAQKAIEA